MSVLSAFKRAVILFMLNSLHTLVLWVLYIWLSVPGISLDSASDDQELIYFAKGLVWVLQRVIPPLFAVQWITFETKAISRIFTGDDRFKSIGSTLNRPTFAQTLDRCQTQGFEQTLMTLAVCSALTLVDLRPLDLRLPVAWAWTFIVGRPFYVFGYILDPEVGRGLGLFLGGFWMNIGALLYCFWVSLGFAPSFTNAIRFYEGSLVIMIVLITSFSPQKHATNAGDAKVE